MIRILRRKEERRSKMKIDCNKNEKEITTTKVVYLI